MKKLIGILAVLFLFTGVALATDFSMNGSYYVRGHYFDNVIDPNIGNDAYGLFDHEMNLDTTWQIDDTTKVFVRSEIRDQDWVGGNDEGFNTNYRDDNIAIERIWGAHTFGNGGTLTVGLMQGGQWGTKFGDNDYDNYRIKYIQPTSVGAVVLVYQKSAEANHQGNSTESDNDIDAYMLGLITKVGDINVKPLLVYLYDNTNPGIDGDVFQFQLAIDGKLSDAVSFETEGQYHSYNDLNNDAEIWGLYGKINIASGPATFSVLGAYGSYDDGAHRGFSFGDDFCAGGAIVSGDWIALVGDDLGAGWLVAGLVSYQATDKLTLGGYLGYWEGDAEVNDTYGVNDASLVEISGTASYAITPNLVYSVGLGVAQLDDMNDGALDPDNSVYAFHKLTFSF